MSKKLGTFTVFLPISDRSKNFESSQVREYFGEKLKTKNALSWVKFILENSSRGVVESL